MDARERQAIEFIRQGHQNLAKAIPLLSELYGPRVINLCQIYLPEHEAQRIAEQTFREFVRGNYEGHSLEDKVHVSLHMIATRLCRERARAIQIEQFPDPHGQNPQASLSQKEKDDRMLLRLRHLGYQFAEIAKIMGIVSADAAKMRYHRLLKALRESKNVPQGT